LRKGGAAYMVSPEFLLWDNEFYSQIFLKPVTQPKNISIFLLRTGCCNL